ncbi:ATP synthase subunit I [Pasteurella atlantica]|uniref:ATP synthase subunit I n=1 Tax=Pasteurella atlantica TaxID=2827233 RepID=A0AAW8CQL2_9PAST|nr:ATP synthase subunit I [Pasteurella atlantica]MDP8034122.1 ATP synthase subunit I [Pasteurella atlantica]MDP8036099.1 ATP synthase subunit I [Pasteurella atlantica]MDP8038049.1 ATP synthase subunit I [Pasteurella atlantica]MDP8040528.1 ATP synthase subunit I [Pasteurella atlantica]MDP8042658.1 ATP synthase subunit I [Pasteurella atlantica]
MSAVINQAKQTYLKAIRITLYILIVSSISISVVKFNSLSSYILGTVAGFIPHCLFTYWVFFRKSSQEKQQITVFYTGEAIKWLVTIVLLILIFKFYLKIDVIVFFLGYFLILICNSLVPFVIKKEGIKIKKN